MDNRGTISGGYAGIIIANGGGVTITNRGTISGGTVSLFVIAGGNTFNIYSGSVFSRPVEFLNTTANTLNFYTAAIRWAFVVIWWPQTRSTCAAPASS